jgi:LuxR family quorum-sensing system transcriptional regulator CciR
MTSKQKEVLCWIAKEKTYGEIASIMNISENTVLYHTKEIFKRLNVNSQMAAVLKSIKFGLITP